MSETKLSAPEIRLRIAELEAERSQALELLESLLPITWSEDWDADEVRRTLERAIRFCGGKAPNAAMSDCAGGKLNS